MYNLPQAAREFVLFQRTGLLPKRRFLKFSRLLSRIGLKQFNHNHFVKSVAADLSYDFETRYFAEMERKANIVTTHLPNNVASILDIGCGIAALDLFLDKLVSPKNIFLLDKTKTDDNV